MAIAASAPVGRATRRREIPWIERYINILGPLVIILTLCLVMAIADPRFFRVQNIMIILQDASIYMVLAMGMTLVITGRGMNVRLDPRPTHPARSFLILRMRRCAPAHIPRQNSHFLPEQMAP